MSVVNAKANQTLWRKSIGQRDNDRKAYVFSQVRVESRRETPVLAVVKMARPPLSSRRGVVEFLVITCISTRLCATTVQHAGRNNEGHIDPSQRRGHKHHYRVVDFLRNKDGIAAKLSVLSTTPIVQRISPWYVIQMVSVATSLRRVVSRLAVRS